MEGSFYVADGDSYLATELTRGPWSPDSQHGGPPCALLARAIERLGTESMQVASIVFDILRPVPIARLRTQARVVRPGRRVELAEAELSDSDGVALIRARAWRMARLDASYGEAAEQPPEPPAAAVERPFFPMERDAGYHTAMELRFLDGAFLEPGPARVWLRMRRPLVDGEPPTPLQRVLVAADSGNGVSAVLDPRSNLFVNVDLSVHLHREPAGEWVGLDAVTHPGAGGRGMADTLLFDERGSLGRACQALLVAPR